MLVEPRCRRHIWHNMPNHPGSFLRFVHLQEPYVPSNSPADRAMAAEREGKLLGLPGHSGSGAYVPGSSATPTVSMNGAESARDLRHIPATSYIVYSNVPKLEAINSKLREFNSMLSASPDNRDMTLGEADVAPGGRLDILLARYVMKNSLPMTSLSQCRGLWSPPDQRWASMHTSQERQSVHLYCLPACQQPLGKGPARSGMHESEVY